MRIRMPVALMILSTLLLASCASVPGQLHEPVPLPGPMTVDIHGTIALDLPNAWVKDLKVPLKAKGELTVKAEAKVVQEKPIRTHYWADITLVISAPDGTPRYVDFATRVAGDMDGPPSGGMIEAIRQLTKAVSLWASSIDAVAPKPLESQPASAGDPSTRDAGIGKPEK